MKSKNYFEQTYVAGAEHGIHAQRTQSCLTHAHAAQIHGQMLKERFKQTTRSVEKGLHVSMYTCVALTHAKRHGGGNDHVGVTNLYTCESARTMQRSCKCESPCRMPTGNVKSVFIFIVL